jgi:Rps23 Pro-64 3,4-dihydroxylase Tpa1-like proline 4-hydroxylase
MVVNQVHEEFVVLDELYNEEELEMIWEELTFLTSPYKLRYPSETGTSYVGNQEQKSNRAIWLDQVYADPDVSSILNISQKLLSYFIYPPFSDHLIMHPIEHVNRVSALVSYYEENDEYKKHHDDTMFTACTWFVREPRKFEGGNLIITDFYKQQHEIELKNNRVILFRGATKHQVQPVVNYTGEPFSGDGRYTLSQFMTIV